jgi:hypothetical protein
MVDDALGGGVGPSLGGFVLFVQDVMAPPAPFDPTTSNYVPYAYNYAVQAANNNLQFVTGQPGAWNIYALSVYNLAADFLIQITQDPPGAPVVAMSEPPMPYWQWLRKQYGISSVSLGIVQSTGDNGTSTSLLLPQQFASFTLANMMQAKTPYGRQYLAMAGSWGSLWGMD